MASEVIEVRLLQLYNTSSSMVVTELGRVIEVILLQYVNAPLPIVVTGLGMTTSPVFPAQ